MTNIVLFLLDRLQPIFRALGTDYGQLRAIAAVKLTLDNRRSYATLGSLNKKAESGNNAFVWMLGTYALIGGLIAGMFLAIPPRESITLPLALFFGYVMVVCAMTLISDFSSVVLDSADNAIVLPRPVDSRTLLMARLVHIASYLFAITLAVVTVAILIVATRFGAVAGLLLLLLSLLSSLLMVFLTNVFYLVLMQFISEERLREVINYFQIVMAVVFYGGYQLLPRIVDYQSLTQVFNWTWWHYLLPPFWMAGALEIVIQPVFDGAHTGLLLLALTAPFAGLWVMNRYLSPVFNQRLAGVDQADTPTAGPVNSKPAGSLADRIGDWVTTNSLEKAAFTFVWYQTARDRKFKLKTYPQLGFGLAYIIAMSVNGTWNGLARSGNFYLFALYFALIYIATAQQQLGVSDNFKAAWIYETAPIQQPGHVLAGALKALIIKLMLPFYLLLAAYVLFRWGSQTLDDILLAFVNSIIMLLSVALNTKRYLPFSITLDTIKQNVTARNFTNLFILGGIGAFHYGLTYVPYGVWVAVPVMTTVAIYLFRQYRQTDWSGILLA